MKAFWICLTVSVFLLAGCGAANFEPKPSTDGVVYTDEKVQLPIAPQITVQPMTRPLTEPTAVFFPFRIMQPIAESEHLGRELGRIFWHTWLRDKVFNIFPYQEDTQWINGQHAVQKAREMGADLAVGGEITYLYAGGTTADSHLSLRLYIYEAATGGLIWAMEHSGSMEKHAAKDWIILKQKSRMPASPLHAITRAVAVDLAAPVKQWMFPEETAPEAPAEPEERDLM